VVIEGTVTDVMETWPLQLFVKTDKGTCHVALAENTAVITRGRPAGPEQLLPGLIIRAEGDASGSQGMRATRIEIR
jgi:hypothetical protein